MIMSESEDNAKINLNIVLNEKHKIIIFLKMHK